MHRCQQFLFPFAWCLKQIRSLPAVCVCCWSCSNTNEHYWQKNLQEKGLSFVKDWHMFLKIIQDSLSKHFAAVTEQYWSCHCTNKAQHLWGQFYDDAHTGMYKGSYFLFPEAWDACRAWVVCRAGVKWLPASATLWVGCGTSGTQQDGMLQAAASAQICILIRHIPGSIKHCKEIPS